MLLMPCRTEVSSLLRLRMRATAYVFLWAIPGLVCRLMLSLESLIRSSPPRVRLEWVLDSPLALGLLEDTKAPLKWSPNLALARDSASGYPNRRQRTP